MISKIKDVHIIGIRSKTKLTKAVLDEAKNLLGIGCFCIGTNQVDLKAAADKGVSNLDVKSSHIIKPTFFHIRLPSLILPLVTQDQSQS